ncbi:MAG: C40 family peptidase [Acidimicrobiales bacterium]
MRLSLPTLFRRVRCRVGVPAVLASVAVMSVLVIAPSPARADTVSSIQARAAQIQSQIDALGAKDGALSQRYDGAVLHVQAIDIQVTQDQAKLAAADAQARKAEDALRAQAVQQFMGGGNAVKILDIVQGSASNVELRSQYVDAATQTEGTALDQLHIARRLVAAKKAQLVVDQGQAKATLAVIDTARRQVTATEVQLQGLYSQVKGQLATAIQAQQAAALVVEQNAANARLAAARAAAAAAAPPPVQAVARTSPGTGRLAPLDNGSGQGGAPASPPQSAPSNLSPAQGASGAVRAAENQVGTPYVWGGSSPGGFDCSGLVMWAWSQVGVSLPHYTGAQYDATTHISMGSIQPGDLLFNGDLSHVAMYVGNGQMVEAAHTGTNVRIVPVRSEMVFATRV